MARLNREWHLAHTMPERATLDERIAWHLEHAAHCACREIPESLVDEMRRRGLEPPRTKGVDRDRDGRDGHAPKRN
jgi:hypothetical protein